MSHKTVISLEDDLPLLIRLQIAALVLIVPAAYLFYLPVLHQISSPLRMLLIPIGLAPRFFDWLLIALIGFCTLMVHEAVHALMFRLLGPRRNELSLGLTLGYAYVGAPSVVYSRGRYAAVGLAPLFIITALLLAAIHAVPKHLLAPLLAAGVINASGSVGDIFVVYRVLSSPRGTLVRDNGAEFTLYHP